MGSLPIELSTAQNIFNPSKSKYQGKYSEVFRNLLFYRYGIKICLINSYAGRHKTAVHLKCATCKQLYKLTAQSYNLFNNKGITYAVMSNNFEFCQCAATYSKIYQQ